MKPTQMCSTVTWDAAKVSTTPWETAEAAVAAKAEAADCLLLAAAREEAVAVASMMATVLPVDLAYEKDVATAGAQVCSSGGIVCQFAGELIAASLDFRR